jgi:hypothetical protein
MGVLEAPEGASWSYVGQMLEDGTYLLLSQVRRTSIRPRHEFVG